MVSTSVATAKTYATDPGSAGDLGVFAAGELSLKNNIPSSFIGGFGDWDTTSSVRPTYGETGAGATLDAALVPTDRIGVGSREFNPDRGTLQFATHVRAGEGRQYAVRFHLTSTQQVNRQSQIRLRGRSVKFAWSQKFEFGGAWATDGGKTYPLNANNSIAQQTVPGLGTENPDRNPGETAGAWYTMMLHTPLSNDIRPEFPPATPIAVRMPFIAVQPGPGVNLPSRRDILFGMDLVDTLSNGLGKNLESGNVTIDRIEVREYDLVPD
jgi:hypothetical protein